MLEPFHKGYGNVDYSKALHCMVAAYNRGIEDATEFVTDSDNAGLIPTKLKIQ